MPMNFKAIIITHDIHIIINLFTSRSCIHAEAILLINALTEQGHLVQNVLQNCLPVKKISALWVVHKFIVYMHAYS